MSRTNGLVLLSHGSVSETRTDTLRVHQSRLQQVGWPLVQIGFLNYGQPAFEEAMASCAAAGAEQIAVVPYFLVAGRFMTQDVPCRLTDYLHSRPHDTVTIAPALLDAPEITEAVIDVAGNDSWDAWVVMAHGSPIEESNDDIRRVISAVRSRTLSPVINISYLDCNEPRIPDALVAAIEGGARRIRAIPYFLHNGRHVATDIPALIRKTVERYPYVRIELSSHIGNSVHITNALSRLATEALAERIAGNSLSNPK